jgi:DNA-binding MarR family transcriptional regulator
VSWKATWSRAAIEPDTLGARVTSVPPFRRAPAYGRTAYAEQVSTESAVSAGGDPGLALAPGPDLALAPGGGDPVIDVARLRVALARLARRLRRHEIAGLTPTQLAALATVGKEGPMRLGDLAAAEGIAPSTLTRLVTALEESGYVRRGADPSDARASTLAITPHGQDVLERIRSETTLVLAASLELLTPAQRSALAEALPVLEQLAEAPGSGPAEARNRSLRQLREPAGQLVPLAGDLGEPTLQFDDAADGQHRDALVGHAHDLLDDPDLVARVASLAARGPLRRDDLQVVDAAQERLLDREHLGDLPDGVQRRVLVV